AVEIDEARSLHHQIAVGTDFAHLHGDGGGQLAGHRHLSAPLLLVLCLAVDAEERDEVERPRARPSLDVHLVLLGGAEAGAIAPARALQDDHGDEIADLHRLAIGVAESFTVAPERSILRGDETGRAAEQQHSLEERAQETHSREPRAVRFHFHESIELDRHHLVVDRLGGARTSQHEAQIDRAPFQRVRRLLFLSRGSHGVALDGTRFALEMRRAPPPQPSFHRVTASPWSATWTVPGPTTSARQSRSAPATRTAISSPGQPSL